MSLELSVQSRSTLLQVARRSIESGLASNKPFLPDPEAYDAQLRRPRACFVTLYGQGELRGCIGCLEAKDALVVEVARAAYSAAFRDPRFPKLRREELNDITLSLSVLSESEPVEFEDEQDLLRKLRPGIDGVTLRDGMRSGTFLPVVWEQLPAAEQFLSQLKVKAGLPRDHWSDTIKVERYTTISFSAADLPS